MASELVQRGHREIKPQEVIGWAQIDIRVRGQVEDEGVAGRYFTQLRVVPIDPELSRRHGRKRHLKLERLFRGYRHGASTERPLVAQPRESHGRHPLRLNNQGWGLRQPEAPGNGFLDRDRLHVSFPSEERVTGSQIDQPASREPLGYLVRSSPFSDVAPIQQLPGRSQVSSVETLGKPGVNGFEASTTLASLALPQAK